MKNIFFRSSVLIPILLFLFSSLMVKDSSAQWTQTNGPLGGSIYSLASSGDKIFAGTINGIYLSTDNGQNWNSINNGIPLNQVSAILINNSNIIIADYPGIYQSSNDGKNWSSITNEMANKSITTLESCGEYIFAGTYYEGIFRTTNNGTNWTAVNRGFSSTSMIIPCLKADGNKLYASSYTYGVYISTNFGENWQNISGNLITGKIISLLVKGSSLFAGARNYYGIFLSTNNGVNWTSINSGLGTNIYWVYTLVSNSTNIFAGTNNGIYTSTNNGTNWVSVNDQYTIGRIYSLSVSSEKLFAGKEEKGVFLTTNNGTNWTSVSNGIKNQSIHCFYKVGNSLLAGSVYGMYKTTNKGSSWIDIGNGVSSVVNQIVMMSSENIFLATDFTGVLRSTNNGDNWIPAGLAGYYIESMAINGIDIFAGVDSYGLYRSTNNGQNWAAIGTNGLSANNITCLTICGNFIFAGDPGGGIFRSADNGYNWVDCYNGLTLYQASCFCVNGVNLYAGMGSDYYKGEGGIFLSTNYGDSWDNISIDVNANIVRSLASIGSNVFAGTDLGIFASSNNGSNWTNIDMGFDFIPDVYSLAISDGFLFAGVLNHSVWSRPLSQIVGIQNISNNIPDKFSLSQNYPNPFNPTTKISFSLPLNSFVKLKVFDATGREVTRLVNENLSAGTYEYEFNAANLPSDVYFYTLETERFSETKKMILIK